jgi:hypothetical protein
LCDVYVAQSVFSTAEIRCYNGISKKQEAVSPEQHDSY